MYSHRILSHQVNLSAKLLGEHVRLGSEKLWTWFSTFSTYRPGPRGWQQSRPAEQNLLLPALEEPKSLRLESPWVFKKYFIHRFETHRFLGNPELSTTFRYSFPLIFKNVKVMKMLSNLRSIHFRMRGLIHIV